MLIAKNLLTREASYKVFGTHNLVLYPYGYKLVLVLPSASHRHGMFVAARTCDPQFVELREKPMNNLRQIARAGRAETLAWKTLESLPLGAADDDEKTRRKLHLIKGPEEFQGIRIDQPPAPSLENKRSHANCGPMTQQGMMGAHGREMYPQGFLRLTGCHKSNRQGIW